MIQLAITLKFKVSLQYFWSQEYTSHDGSTKYPVIKHLKYLVSLFDFTTFSFTLLFLL